METKARIGLFVGGLVLVGMVAYVMMPRSAEPKADDALTAAQTPSDSVDYAAAASTQPATTQPIAITDPFAAPAPAATPAVAAGGTGIGNGAISEGSGGASVTTLGQQPAAQPTSGDDAWGRALDGGTTQTRSVGGSLSSHSSLLSEASSLSAAASSSTPGAQKTYKVEAGDSPFTISQKLFGDGKYASKIMAANPGVNARRLKPGQELAIPDITAKETAAGSSVAGTADHTDPVPVAGASAGAKTYKVQAGDTLTRISSKLYGKSSMWKQLYAANKSKIGADPTRLRAGMVLQVPDNVQ